MNKPYESRGERDPFGFEMVRVFLSVRVFGAFMPELGLSVRKDLADQLIERGDYEDYLKHLAMAKIAEHMIIATIASYEGIPYG